MGDQVKIKGKLVDIFAKNIGEPGKFDPESFEWKSSVTREDTGGGACETIYVEDIEILKKANTTPDVLFKFSLYGLLLVFLLALRSRGLGSVIGFWGIWCRFFLLLSLGLLG